MIILDTNVVSEFMRPADQRHAGAVRWLRRQAPESLYLTVVSVAEVLAGIAVLPEGRRKAARQEAAVAVLALFRERMLVFDLSAVEIYAAISALRRRTGRPLHDLDNQIIAIARANGMAVATRNTRDFEDCGVELINPWAA